MFRKTFNDSLALLLLIIIPALWFSDAFWAGFDMPGEVMGALIATWTLVIQFYFRRSPGAP